MKLSKADGTEEGRAREGRERGRAEAPSGPVYANPRGEASKSGSQPATAEEWALFSHREKRGKRGARE